MKRLILAILALVTFGVGATALTATPAHAAYTFPGLSVIDTQRSSCDNYGTTGDAGVDCYTWIRTNGVLRRGSPAEYFSEAGGGFVLTACSQALRFVQDYQPGLYKVDWYGNWAERGAFEQPQYYYWQSISNHPYCTSPVTPAGYYWAGYRWNMVPNANPQ